VHAASMRKMGNAYKCVNGEREAQTPFSRSMYKCENNIKMYPKEIQSGNKGFIWIEDY
jgi:hypothetical protein